MAKVNNYKVAADLIVDGANSKWVGKVLGVAQSMADGVVVFDPERANGKGGYKGVAKAAEAMASENEQLADLVNMASVVTLVAKALTKVGAFVVAATDADRLAEAECFCAQYTENMCKELVYESSSKGRTLAAIVASMFTEAVSEKNGYSVEAIMSEVVAQAEALNSQEG